MEINQAVTHIFPMVDTSDTSKEVTLTQGQKMKKMTTLCQDIISIGYEGGMKVFKSQYQQLQDLLTQWKNKEDIISLTDDHFLNR